MLSVLIVGQFPPPITGEAEVNVRVRNLLKRRGIDVISIDSCIIDSADNVGSFAFRKLYLAFIVIISSVLKGWSCKLWYVVPGQSKLGLARSIILIFMGVLLRKKVILHWHGYGALNQINYIRRFKFLFGADLVTNIFLTNDLANKLSSNGVVLDNIVVVRNYSTMECLENITDKSSLGEKLIVLYVGSLMEDKGILTLLEVARESRNFRYIICGDGSESIKAKVIESHVAGHVDYQGVVIGEQKSSVFRSADIFVLQSSYKTEGVPISILEALSQGCAIIVSDINGMRETLEHDAVYVPSDRESLVRALKYFDHNRDYLKEVQQKAIERSKRYAREIFDENILRVIKELGGVDL